MKLFVSFAFAAASFLALAAGCDYGDKPKISLEGGAHSTTAAAATQPPPLRIAVGGMTTPREGLAYYRDFLIYLQEKVGQKIQYVDREGYEEINQMLKTGSLDAAFVCSGPYVKGKEEFGLELLVAPQAYGATVYYSYIIVHKDSSFKSLRDLEKKRFAFTDPMSNTGKLVPTYMLAKMGTTPEAFFQEVIFTKSHDMSIKTVAKKVVDGAAVDSLVWEYMNAKNPEFTSQTRILLKSPPYGIPPVAVTKSMAPELKSRLKEAFLEAHKDPRGLEILRNMKLDRFVVIDDRAYDSVREMEKWIAGRQKGK